MRPTPNPSVERYRIALPTQHPYHSTVANGNNGAFQLMCQATRTELRAIVSDGRGWEHVSVSVPNARRCPTWTEMCFVKDLFWDPEELVVQYHPRKSEYVKCHPFVLHLWRPEIAYIISPPTELIGPLGVEVGV